MTVLPIFVPTDTARATAQSAAASGRTTSSSGMRWAGEKKCMPTTRSGWVACEAMSLIGKAEVFEAMTAVRDSAASRSFSTWCLTARFSKTASITRSFSPNPE